MRDSFVFYRSFYESIQELDNDTIAAVIKAISEKALNDTDPQNISGTAKAVYILIKPQIEANQKKYENGCLGGRPKTEAKADNSRCNTGTKPNGNQSVTGAEPNANVNVNDNVNENENDIPPCNPPAGDGAAKKSQQAENLNVKKARGAEAESSADQSVTPADPSFDRFWEAYPKKQGKGKAKQLWAKLKPGSALLDKILSAVQAAKQTEQWNREDGRYIPHPATWLGQGRWEDDYTPASAGCSVTVAAPKQSAPQYSGNPFLQMLREERCDG